MGSPVLRYGTKDFRYSAGIWRARLEIIQSVLDRVKKILKMLTGSRLPGCLLKTRSLLIRIPRRYIESNIPVH